MKIKTFCRTQSVTKKVEHNHNLKEFFVELEKNLISFFKGIGHEVEVKIIHKAQEAAKEAIDELAKETTGENTGATPAPEKEPVILTPEAKAWALQQWPQHCDKPNEPMPEDWAVVMWQQHTDGGDK